MSMADDVRALPETFLNKCAVARLFMQLSGDEKVAVGTAIDNPLISISALRVILARNGYEISDSVIRRHRNRLTGSGCSCP